jgi:hypothetical protein
MKAWHFLPADRRLRWGDGRRVRRGHVAKVDGPVVLCDHGLHASTNILDALCYAPGPILCRVDVRGDIVRGDDKLAGTERECLWWIDATRTLHEFACWCAERALKRAKVTDERSWNAIRVKRAWLDGKATDAELDAARDAAWAAARDAAGDAALDAAWDAAWAAAWAAAWDAAWDAERKAQARKLRAMAEAAR